MSVVETARAPAIAPGTQRLRGNLPIRGCDRHLHPRFSACVHGHCIPVIGAALQEVRLASGRLLLLQKGNVLNAERHSVLGSASAVFPGSQFPQESLQLTTFGGLGKEQVLGFARVDRQVEELAGGLGGRFRQGVLLEIALAVVVSA